MIFSLWDPRRKRCRLECRKIYMLQVLIFDLDDTLYEERQYVESGFRAVAGHLHVTFGWGKGTVYRRMLEILAQRGRGRVFDLVLRERNIVSKRHVADCVMVYRTHKPMLHLAPQAKKMLSLLRGRSCYLVTDGHKIVQATKIKALGLDRFFKGIYITHRYGICHAKPSTYCFDLIRRRASCDWTDMAYIGDNPAKDFVNLNPLGVITIRVLTGVHRKSKAKAGYDSRFTINSLDELKHVEGVFL